MRGNNRLLFACMSVLLGVQMSLPRMTTPDRKPPRAITADETDKERIAKAKAKRERRRLKRLGERNGKGNS